MTEHLEQFEAWALPVYHCAYMIENKDKHTRSLLIKKNKQKLILSPTF